MSGTGVGKYLDRASEAVLGGDGLVIDEKDPEIPVPVRDTWGFYRAIAVDRPWILQGIVAAEVGAALLLRRRARRGSTLAAFGAVLLVTDAVGELLTQAYARRHTDDQGRLVLPPRPRDDPQD